ncbi:MAG TPA: glycosyltransferase family 4 protein [Verrucomicrobiae bacterium]
MQSFIQPVRRRLDGYRRRLAHEHYMWSIGRVKRKNSENYEKWIAHLNRTTPDVLVGTNFPSGGVRHHVHAIRQYSSLRVELAPPEELVKDFGLELRQMFSAFTPTRVRAIHSHVLPWFIEWCRAKQQSGLRWIHTYHLNYFPEHGKNGVLPWQNEINEALLKVACHADVRISVARWQQQDLLKNHKISTFYIPNGVDIATCDKGNPARFQKIVGKDKFVLFVGRNDPVKNPEDFVRLAERLPRLRFVMMGHGLTRKLVTDEWEIPIPRNLVIFSAASHAQVQDAIAACSALVVTSKREGLPTLVMEAMAQQKPVVVPNEAGSMEAISDGDFGFIYSQGNLDDLADCTIKAIADTRKCQHSRQRILSEYDWRVTAPKLDAIYTSDPRAALESFDN